MPPLGEPKPKILEKYGAYVKALAAQVRKQFSAQFDMEELISWGQVGLLEAADRYDPRLGSNFLTFAHYRIKGSIYDGLRKMGMVQGSSSGERANSYLSNLSDRSTAGGDFDDDVRDISSTVTGLAIAFATSIESTEGLQLTDSSISAEERLETEQLRRRIRRAIEQLPENEQKLLEGYYFHSKTLEEAGAHIGQSKSWASRLHARAIERLKQLLEADGDNSEDFSRSENGRTPGRSTNSGNRSESNRRGPAGHGRSG